MSGIALLAMQYADVVLGELHHPTTHRNAFDHSAAVAGIVASLAYEQDEIDAVPLRSIRASAEFVRFKPTGMRTITRSVSKLSRSGGTLGSVRSMPVQAPPRPSITGLRPFACAARNASRVAESFTLGCCAMTRSSGTWAASNRSRLSWDQKSIALIASARDAQHPQPRCWGHRARIIRPQPDAIPKMAIGREC